MCATSRRSARRNRISLGRAIPMDPVGRVVPAATSATSAARAATKLRRSDNFPPLAAPLVVPRSPDRGTTRGAASGGLLSRTLDADLLGLEQLHVFSRPGDGVVESRRRRTGGAVLPFRVERQKSDLRRVNPAANGDRVDLADGDLTRLLR